MAPTEQCREDIGRDSTAVPKAMDGSEEGGAVADGGG
jgi:hypothetical protein